MPPRNQRSTRTRSGGKGDSTATPSGTTSASAASSASSAPSRTAPTIPATTGDQSVQADVVNAPPPISGDRVVYVAAVDGRSQKTPSRFTSVGAFFGAVVKYVSDAFGIVVFVLKYPFSLFVVSYILLFLFGHVVDTATESLAPICAVFPKFPVCRATAAAGRFTATFGHLGRKHVVDIQRVDFPGLMALQSRTLDQLLAHSAAGSQLALSVKHAELAVKDLSIVVKISNLTSKEILARSLEEFALDAKAAGRDIQRLSAKLYGAVDTVLAFDDYALRALATSQVSGDDVTQTATDVFQSTMSVLASEVARVMLDAASVASSLDGLEEKLGVIRAICEKEMIFTKAALGDVLSELWTFLGGNRVKLAHLERQIDILRNVDWYRSLSVAHVVATTETLLMVDAELSELRDKLSAPELTGDSIPIEVHIAGIERSARRIKEERLKVRSDISTQRDGSGIGQWPVGRPQSLLAAP